MNTTKVMLPSWVIESDDPMLAAQEYLKRHPGYTVIEIVGDIAICLMSK